MIFIYLNDLQPQGCCAKKDKKAQICILFSQNFYQLLKILIIHLDIHKYHLNFKQVI